jgi:glutathione synthase
MSSGKINKKRALFRFLWVTDPWDTLDHASDTTLRLAQEASRMGFSSYWCDVKSVRWQDGQTKVDAALVTPDAPTATKKPFPVQTFDVSTFSSIHYRVDPPVDLAYLHPLQLLNLGLQTAKKTKAKIVNAPSLLFSQNEKTEAAFLKRLMPESLVSSQWEHLKEFTKKNRKVVLKPLHEAQSHGVELLQWKGQTEEQEIQALLNKATSGFQNPVLLQAYLPGIAEGEQRLWFLDGKLLAIARKLPLKGDFRVNIDGGSLLQKTFLNSKEQDAARKIGKYLKSAKIRLAAVDLIDCMITDFNFTSPGLITQIEKLLGQNLAKPIILALARK